MVPLLCARSNIRQRLESSFLRVASKILSMANTRMYAVEQVGFSRVSRAWGRQVFPLRTETIGICGPIRRWVREDDFLGRAHRCVLFKDGVRQGLVANPGCPDDDDREEEDSLQMKENTRWFWSIARGGDKAVALLMMQLLIDRGGILY